MLRDRLVCGVNNQLIQKRLRIETNLTYATALEAAEKNALDLTATGSTAPVYSTKRSKESVTQHTRCYRCGGAHAASTCKFKTAECYNCKKLGQHVAPRNKSSQNGYM